MLQKVPHGFKLTVVFLTLLAGIRAQLNQETAISAQLDSLRIIFQQEQARFSEKLLESSDSSLLIGLSKVDQLQQSQYDPSAYYKSYDALLRRDLGLQLNLDGIQNFNISQEDLEENILYQRRFQTGLEWNILNGGFMDARNQRNALPTQEMYDRQLNYYQQLKRNSSAKMNACIYWFNQHKIALLDQRDGLLNKQYQALEKLYFAKKITREHLLRNQTRIAEIKGMQGIYRSYNDYFPGQLDTALLNSEPALFDLNYEKLLAITDGGQGIDSLSVLLREQAMQQHKWYNEIRLKTFFKYNYYDLLTTNPSARAFYNTGISAGIPLPFNQKQQRELELQKVNKQIDQLQVAQQNKRVEILNDAYEFRYQLKQYIVFHQKRILAWESIRQERVKAKLQDADFNPVHGLELLDDLLQIEIELLDLKQNLYIKLLKIHEKTGLPAIEELIIPLELPNYFNFEDDTYRTAYVWTKTFEQQDVNFLSEYILYNQFDEIQLAVAQEDKQVDKKLQLIEQLNNKGVKVQLMLGQNELLGNPEYQKILANLIKPYLEKGISGIHLDIEPHTRADWKTNREVLQEQYKMLLKETKTYCSSYKLLLSIDLPLSLDTLYAAELIGQVDAVRFMCYENIKEDYLLRKLSPYQVFGAKRSISLRTEDFANRQEMEKFAKNILQQTGIQAINFHDLNRLINLDKQSLTPNEEH